MWDSEWKLRHAKEIWELAPPERFSSLMQSGDVVELPEVYLCIKVLVYDSWMCNNYVGISTKIKQSMLYIHNWLSEYPVPSKYLRSSRGHALSRDVRRYTYRSIRDYVVDLVVYCARPPKPMLLVFMIFHDRAHQSDSRLTPCLLSGCHNLTSFCYIQPMQKPITNMHSYY